MFDVGRTRRDTGVGKRVNYRVREGAGEYDARKHFIYYFSNSAIEVCR